MNSGALILKTGAFRFHSTGAKSSSSSYSSYSSNDSSSSLDSSLSLIAYFYLLLSMRACMSLARLVLLSALCSILWTRSFQSAGPSKVWFGMMLILLAESVKNFVQSSLPALICCTSSAVNLCISLPFSFLSSCCIASLICFTRWTTLVFERCMGHPLRIVCSHGHKCCILHGVIIVLV